MPTNMVLRFRDLIEETIHEHRKHIKQSGYVWWGWWNKPDEKVPRKELLHFQDIIKDKGHMWIYLADSGTLRLYKAKLIEIDISKDEEAKECREIDKMPEYYFTAKYKVWFRFANIEDAIPDEIREWSYDNPSDFLYVSDMAIFQDKRVASIHEMLNERHRTIYFIQPYDPKLHSDFLIGGTSANEIYRDKSSPELENYVDDILKLIEQINKHCDYAPKKVFSPIRIPAYQKEMENALKCRAQDETSFREFSSYIYMLIVDGHQQVMDNDGAIISKSEFLGFASLLLRSIRLLRCDLHHSGIRDNDKKQLGRLYNEVCGKSVLDDANSRLKFQLELLKRTVEVLKEEYELVKEKISRL